MGNRYPFNGFETMASGYTNGMYLPSKPLDEWNIDECRRALCRQANGDVMRCLECENKCRYGKRIEVLLAPVERTQEQEPEQPTPAKSKRGVASAAANKRRAEIKFYQIIASGNPKAYPEAHGMEVRNNMSRLRTKYKDVTPEEARKRLAEMGVEVEEAPEASVIVTEIPAELPAMVEMDTKAECEAPASPAKAANVKLKIDVLRGEYFTYTRENGTVEIEPNQVCIADVSDVEEICAEIKAAFAMMA